jgi:hypothetical protein
MHRYTEEAFISNIDALAAELPKNDPDGLFHKACARDSCGHSAQAIPLYRQALELGGLTGENRRRAVIQMASSMRNVGQAEAAMELLLVERDRGSDHLDDALACTAALCLSSLNRDREGLSMVLVALAKHLPRYNRSMTNYANALVENLGGSAVPGVTLE